MDSLVNFSSVGSSLPWLWIIEYLASIKEVDTSILHDLTEMAPGLLDDLAKSTREMIALRCLEDLVARSDKVNDEGLSATEKKVGFALSESCEDVLQHILQETSASDLKRAGPELLKWDVHAFVTHKRALMPKCALQQLKDTILEGTHPLAASLKESSGLMYVNESDRAVDVNHNGQAISGKENSVSSTCETRDGLSGNDLHNRNVLLSKRDRNDMAAGEVAGHTDVREEFDVDYNAKKLKPDAIINDQLVDHRCEKEIVEDPSGRVVAVDGGEGDISNQSLEEGRKEGEMEHSCGEEMSSDNDEYNNVRIDVAMKKNHFLSSNCSLGYDSLAKSSWTEQNLCVKCNKDGQLLVCSTSSCPMVVHEKCLSFPIKFDEKGNFHCPFCAYSLAISDFLEAKKKASLARKELAAFIQVGLECHPEDLADRLHKKESNHSRINGDKDIHENGHLGGQENNQENQNGQHLCDLNDHLWEKVRGSKKQLEPSTSCVNGTSSSREEEENVFSGRAFLSNVEKVMEENVVEECPSERGLNGDQDQAPPDPQSDCDKRTFTNIGDAPVDHTDADGKVQKEDLHQASGDPSEKPVFALNIDGEETSGGENDKFIISNYQIRFRRRETYYTYPAIPQLRRKKVPWTAKEEEMLKRGVRKFDSVEERGIPWKKILEFGSSVFLSGRTTTDLKDKWRNMCKGSPRSK